MVLTFFNKRDYLDFLECLTIFLNMCMQYNFIYIYIYIYIYFSASEPPLHLLLFFFSKNEFICYFFF